MILHQERQTALLSTNLHLQMLRHIPREKNSGKVRHEGQGTNVTKEMFWSPFDGNEAPYDETCCLFSLSLFVCLSNCLSVCLSV